MNSVNHAFDRMKDQKIIHIDVVIKDKYVTVTYTDNGNGISPEILPKIFEPFITSKRGNGGSGLGTNIIYNLTTKVLGGKIECNNLDAPQHGARFAITFPVTAPGK